MKKPGEIITPEVREVRQLLERIREKFSDILLDRHLAEQLFRHSDERSRLLLKAGGFVFTRLSELLRREIVLGLCRLTDSAEGRRHKKGNPPDVNLSLDLLVQAVEKEDAELGARLRAGLTNLTLDVEPLRFARHKALAHNDYDHLKARSHGGRCPPILFEDVDRLVSRIIDLLNHVERRYLGWARRYGVVTVGADGDWLAALLAPALAESDSRRPIALGKK